jgi:hypothetical protein
VKFKKIAGVGGGGNRPFVNKFQDNFQSALENEGFKKTI